MAIHIPSSKMTSLPSYNLIVDNKITSNVKSVKLENGDTIDVETALSYSYNNITSIYGDCLYEFKIQKDKLYSTTATDVGADELAYSPDNSAIIIRKRISLTDKIVSLNWERLASGLSSISPIYIQTNIESIWYQIPKRNIDDTILMSTINLSTYKPAIDTEIGIAIDVVTLKYNFIDMIAYIPLEKLKNSTATEFFYKFMNNTEGYGSWETLNYIFYVENASVDGNISAFESSELIQTQTTINQIPIYKHLTDNIIEHFKNGRQTMSLTCVYGEYRDYETGAIVINGIDGKMVDVGDIVVPTRLYTDTKTNTNSELPIAVDKNGNAIQFEVLSSEIEFSNGKLVTHLKLMEVR